MVEALINGKPKLCIVDTGASISLMSKDEWQLLKGSDSKKIWQLAFLHRFSKVERSNCKGCVSIAPSC